MTARFPFPIPFGWYCVAYSDELQVGEVKPLHYFARELVLFRGESGEAKLLDAYCPHLGAHLGHGGTVKDDCVVCPFHGWSFNGDGACTSIPYAKAMPRKVTDGANPVRSYPTVERNRMIFAWYHPYDEQPMYEVVEHAELHSEQWSALQSREWVIKSAIQETGENAVDSAHFIYVHKMDRMPEGKISTDKHMRTSYFDLMDEADADGAEAAAQVYTSAVESISNGPGQTWTRAFGLVETLQLGLITPIDAETIQFRFAFTQPAGQSEEQQLMGRMMMDELYRQVEADIPIWENKIYRDSPMLCDGDGPINQYRKWFRQFYAEPLHAV